jgi:carbonic anhydrase
VHRNIANVVVHTDMNCLSVIQFAVEALGVEHIIVCGHYNCGGVKAAMDNVRFGLINNWLRHIQDAIRTHAPLLGAIEDEEDRFARLCELNVLEQALNVCETTFVQDAWEKSQNLTVHGWIYEMREGVLRKLGIHLENNEQLEILRQNKGNFTKEQQ